MLMQKEVTSIYIRRSMLIHKGVTSIYIRRSMLMHKGVRSMFGCPEFNRGEFR